MKAKFFMIAALAAAVSFASCQKEGGSIGAAGDPVNITLKLANESFTKTRANYNGTDDLTGLVQNIVSLEETEVVYVYMFNASGTLTLDGPQTSTVEDLKTGGGVTYKHVDHPNLTTATNRVILVSNVGTGVTLTDASGGLLESAMTLTKLQAIVKTLGATITDYAAGATTGKIMVYGDSDSGITGTGIAWGAAVDGVTNGTATIDMHPLLSRIDVTVDMNGATGFDATEKTINIDGLAVLYSGKGTHLAPPYAFTYADNAVALASGLKPTASTFTEWYALPHGNVELIGDEASENILHGVWATNYDAVTSKKYTRSFYAYAPTAAADPATTGITAGYAAFPILTVYGERLEWDSNVSTHVRNLFWPVHFDGVTESEGPVMKPGNIYEVALSFTGDFTSDNDGPDIDNPEKEKAANMKVVIRNVQWIAKVAVSKSFDVD